MLQPPTNQSVLQAHEWFWGLRHFQLLGVPRVRAITVPMATPPATISPMRMASLRTRRCFAGAIAAPAGREAITPAPSSLGAAAVPTGLDAPLCFSARTGSGAGDTLPEVEVCATESTKVFAGCGASVRSWFCVPPADPFLAADTCCPQAIVPLVMGMAIRMAMQAATGLPAIHFELFISFSLSDRPRRPELCPRSLRLFQHRFKADVVAWRFSRGCVKCTLPKALYGFSI